MGKQQNSNEEDDIINPQEMFLTVEVDDGKEETFQILKIFEAGNRDYIAVCPVDGSEDVYFYRYFEDAGGNPSVDNIDTDEEFDIVTDMFDQILDDEEFDML
ncbi:MAG: DUF1292 domain-containing protein [Lachnospiraceae bacterium]|nr:DUF1292 domain-containing protein [Lachnospiraceae bacterium]